MRFGWVRWSAFSCWFWPFYDFSPFFVTKVIRLNARVYYKSSPLIANTLKSEYFYFVKFYFIPNGIGKSIYSLQLNVLGRLTHLLAIMNSIKMFQRHEKSNVFFFYWYNMVFNMTVPMAYHFIIADNNWFYLFIKFLRVRLKIALNLNCKQMKVNARALALFIRLWTLFKL